MSFLEHLRGFARLRPVLSGVLTGGVVSASLALTAAVPAAADGKYMRVEDVKPGMKGYGLTVFSGMKPQRFDVEVISTLHNFRPGQDLFLVRTKHPRLDIARTVAGMSGSPIYIDGKMIGAYAYGWLFNVEPIAGVTPIQNMLDDLRRPVPKVLAPGTAGSPLPNSSRSSGRKPRRPNRRAGIGNIKRFRGDPLKYDADLHAQQVAAHTRPILSPPAGSGLRPATTDVMVGGLGPAAFQQVTEWLAPTGLNLVQAGGGKAKKKTAATAGTSPLRYVDGGVVNVQLARGDISMNGLGTVTHVVGDKLIAFGHPMFNGGIENLPTAIGRVHWILSTQNRSFKIGEPVQPLGALVNDRQASIVVDMNRVAPTIPVELNIRGAHGAPKTNWRFEIAHDQFLAPNFTSLAIGNALKATTAERNDMTWRAKSTVSIAGAGDIEIEDFGAGAGNPIGSSTMARARLTRAMGAILNNPWKMGRITGVRVDVRVVHRRETLALRGAQLLSPEIDAGNPARVRLLLQPHYGEAMTRVIEVPVPASLAGRRLTIKLTPGYRARRLLPTPQNFDDLVQTLPNQHFPGETIVASYALPDEAAATFAGQVAKRLPPGAADALQTTTQSLAPRVFAARQKIVFPSRGYIVGEQSVTVKVRNVLR